MYGDFLAKNIVYTPCIPINEWFWPTLVKRARAGQQDEGRQCKKIATTGSGDVKRRRSGQGMRSCNVI
jgi:hypothetical protein